MWYAGMQGGHALADVLSGEHSPRGAGLPFSFYPRHRGAPAFPPPPSRAGRPSTTYDRFHGQRLLDRLGVPAAFPRGSGSHTPPSTCATAVVDSVEEGAATLIVEVANTGGRWIHVVQVYGRSTAGPYAGELFLAGFAPVPVPAASTMSVSVPVSLRPLAAWDAGERRRVLPDPGDVELEVGSHAHDPDAVLVRLALSPRLIDRALVSQPGSSTTRGTAPVPRSEATRKASAASPTGSGA